MSSNRLEERTIKGRVAHLAQDLTQLMSNFLREARRGILFLNLRVFVADLFGGLVFLVQEFQVIDRQKIIEDIRADKVGTRQVNLFKDLRRGVLQDLVSQQHAGGLAPDFSGADAVFQDQVEICGGEPAPGNVNKSQLVADQAFEQHDAQFLQVVIHGGALVAGSASYLSACLKTISNGASSGLNGRLWSGVRLLPSA